TSFWKPMRKSLGDKRREIAPEQIAQIVEIYKSYAESEHSKIFDTTDFGYRKIRVERPLRLNFEASDERIARLRDQRAFQNLAQSRKKDRASKDREETQGRAQQEAILAMLRTLGDERYTDRRQFDQALSRAAKAAGMKLSAPLQKTIYAALGERDETAA